MLLLLLSTIENDDDKAFMLSLYQDYYALVRSTVYKVMRCDSNIDDLVEDTFVKLIEKISLLRTFDCCKTASYVVYTTRSVTINFIRHRDVRQKHSYYGGQEDVLEGLFDTNEPMEDLYLHQEEIEALSEAVLKLPDRQKDLLYFKYIRNMSDAQIAEELSISPDSVREYLTRARRAAKELMEKEDDRHGAQE